MKSEATKTLLFVIGAVACTGAAYLSGRSGSIGIDSEDQVGSVLFPEFNDPYVARSLTVAEFKSDSGEVQEFKVAQKQGQWVIPSHEDYPADAEENLKKAATLLVDLKVLGIASDSGKQALETYGVVVPDAEKVEAGEEGVGKLVSMRDGKGQRLGELVIGKQVKGQDGQRFVRVPSNDRVYVAKIDPDQVSTKFEDWIEKNLLDLKDFDITEFMIRDYSVESGVTQSGQIAVDPEQRLAMTVRWNSEDFAWELGDLQEFRDGKLRPTQLLDDEELNKENLDAMKNALSDLKIVDVRRKPKGLGADLKADKGFLEDIGGVQSLVETGFFPVQLKSGEVDLLSSDGEVAVRVKDGVEYLLRFGEVAGVERGEEESSLNRFVMITASIPEDALPRPELEQLPALSQDDDQNASDASGGEPDAESDDTSEGETADTEEEDAAEANNGDSDEEAGDQDDTDDGDKNQDDKDQDGKDQDDTDQDTDQDDELDAERDRIMKENQRKLDEYKEKREKAEKTVADLNTRFADWYYVISEDVYRRIHLGRGEVIKAKPVEEGKGYDAEAFRKLETEGLEKKEK